jgi:hypothetical protein
MTLAMMGANGNPNILDAGAFMVVIFRCGAIVLVSGTGLYG